MRSQNSFSERIQRSKHSLKRHRKLVTCLAAVVVFAVTYSLVLPAVTLDEQKAEETPGIETQTKVEEQVEKAPAQVQEEEKQAEPANKADQEGSEQSKSSVGDESAKNSDSEKNSSESGSAVKSEKSDSQIKDVKDSDSKDEKADKDDADKDDVKLIDEKTELKFDGDGYKIIAEVGADAKLPADTKLKVKKVNKEAVDENGVEYAYDAYCDEALKAVRNVDGKEAKDETREVMLYDISFDSADVDKAKVKNDKDSEKSILDKVALDKDGNLEPSANVKIKIVFDEALDTSDKGSARAVHFDKRLENMNDEEIANVKKDVLETKTEGDKKDEMKEASFKSDKFSMYGFVYTAELKKEVLTASGDTYEITVSYGEDAQIPEGAELRVREIADTEDEYANNVKLVNKKLKAEKQPEVVDPAQFDISIWANDQEIEPAEGSSVNVEMKLVPEVFVKEDAEGEKAKGSDKKADKESAKKSAKDSKSNKEDEPEIWFNGEKITLDEAKPEDIEYTIAHVNDEGKADVIKGVDSSVDDNDNVVLQFETESFSDYLVDTGTTNTLDHLPNTIYVGDVIYLYNHANYSVNTNGGVVSDISIANNSTYRELKAEKQGSFTITIPAYSDWGGYHPQSTKTIQVRPARTGTTPPDLADGIVNNADVGISLNLFDYDTDETLNDYYNQFNHSTWPYLNSFTNDGINAGHAFKFWGSGVGKWNNEANALNGSQINWNYNHYSDGITTGIVKDQLSGGYPALSGGGDLKYLFEPSDGTDKKAYPGADRLFRKESPDSDYYVYNSNTNYAWYNPSTNQFEVYNSTYEQKSNGEQTSGTNGKAIGFFPFHRWDNEYDLYVNWNKNLKHHFGMSMNVDFSLPKDPKAVKDKQGNDIIFEFSGDDDMWVFIDGKLAMDIGGIHQPVKGQINFTKKTVTTQATAGNDQSVHTQNYSFPDSLYDGKPHKLEVFYIERGGCDSNCMIKFNLTQYVDVDFDKVDVKNVEEKLSGAVFGLYLDEACTKPLVERLKDGTNRAYIAEADANGHIKFEGIGLGTYYLKEMVPPDGYEKDETVRTVNVFLTGQSPFTATYTISGTDADSNAEGMQIGNSMPEPIKLELEKKWQDQNGNAIDAPSNASAVFELHRIRSYEVIEEEELQQENPKTAKLIVGWKSGDDEHIYKEYTLLSGSRATVSWRYKDGYNGEKAVYVDGEKINKNPNNQVFSQATGALSENQEMRMFIADTSANGDAIASINVAGEEYVGGQTGGIVHKFETVTEPDTSFNYTGDEDVVNNRVTLNADNNWKHEFNNLPITGNGNVSYKGQEKNVVFNYAYYLSEVSSNIPSGTTVIYKDASGKVINSPTEAETSTSGKQTIINQVPFGYLQIQKKVTYNDKDTNLTADQKSKLAGEYKFKIYTTAQCGDGDAVQDPNAAADAADKDLTITLTIGKDGQAVSSTPIKLIAGKYWIKEVESSNPGMFPVNNPIEVTVTKDNTTDGPVIRSLTNNYDENNGPDKIAIDIEKKFQGLENKTQVPSDFKVFLQYKVGDQTKTVTLENKIATGENGEKIAWSESKDGFTWHWKVTNIPSNATNFKIMEDNYDKATAHDWKSAALNTTDITSTVTSYHDLVVTAPAATLSDVTNDRRTSDSGNNTEFFLDDDDILLSKLTANQGTLVISKKPLNLAERDAVVKGWPSEGGFKTPPHYFSIEEHPNGFKYGNKTVTFGEKNGRTTVKFTQNASAQETVFAVSYSSQDARNNANFVNVYEEVPITVDIVKIDKNDEGKKLAGAVFTFRPIRDVAPDEHGTIPTVDGKAASDTQATVANDGKTFITGLTHGYYEVKEKSAPAGYVMTDDTTFYFKVENGSVTWLEKGTGAPSTWKTKTAGANDMVTFTAGSPAAGGQAATNATFTVKNEPGAALPSAGGPGTTWMYILGSLLTLMAGVMLVARRRMRA